MTRTRTKIKTPYSESGNALFIILIAVALLGALSYAVTQSNRGGVAALTEEKAKLYAAEILEYAQVVSNAVAQLRLRGCSDTEISFENNVVSGYTNSNAPSDNTCHVFHPSGGGLSWNVPDDNMVSGTASADNWRIYASNEIQDIGTTGGADSNVDLILFLADVDTSICLQLNERLSVSNPSNAPPTDSGLDTDQFQGSYSHLVVIGDEDTALAGQKTACYTDGGAILPSAQNVFYKVLISR